MQDFLTWMKEFDEAMSKATEKPAYSAAEDRLYCDIVNKKEGADITVKQPGINKENTEIDTTAKLMNITCKTEEWKKSATLNLSDSLDTKKTTAECKDGILKIFIPMKKNITTSVKIS